jgi:hypothetical protein
MLVREVQQALNVFINQNQNDHASRGNSCHIRHLLDGDIR